MVGLPVIAPPVTTAAASASVTWTLYAAPAKTSVMSAVSPAIGWAPPVQPRPDPKLPPAESVQVVTAIARGFLQLRDLGCAVSRRDDDPAILLALVLDLHDLDRTNLPCA